MSNVLYIDDVGLNHDAWEKHIGIQLQNIGFTTIHCIGYDEPKLYRGISLKDVQQVLDDADLAFCSFIVFDMQMADEEARSLEAYKSILAKIRLKLNPLPPLLCLSTGPDEAALSKLSRQLGVSEIRSVKLDKKHVGDDDHWNFVWAHFVRHFDVATPSYKLVVRAKDDMVSKEGITVYRQIELEREGVSHPFKAWTTKSVILQILCATSPNIWEYKPLQKTLAGFVPLINNYLTQVEGIADDPLSDDLLWSDVIRAEERVRVSGRLRTAMLDLIRLCPGLMYKLADGEHFVKPKALFEIVEPNRQPD